MWQVCRIDVSIVSTSFDVGAGARCRRCRRVCSMCRRQCRHLLAPARCRRVCFIVNLYVCRRRHLAGVFPPSKSLRVPAPAPAPVPAPCRRVPPSKSLHVPAPTPAPVPALAGVGTLPACLLLVVPAALVACVLAYMRKFPAVRPTENHVTLHRMCIIIYFL